MEVPAAHAKGAGFAGGCCSPLWATVTGCNGRSRTVSDSNIAEQAPSALEDVNNDDSPEPPILTVEGVARWLMVHANAV